MDAKYKPPSDLSACPHAESPKANDSPKGFGLGTGRNIDIEFSQIWQKIWGVLTHQITANTFILSLGRVLASALGFMIGIIVARSLGPADFGLFSISLAVFEIAVVFSEMGVGTTLVRFVPKFAKNDEQRAQHYLKVGFWLLMCSSTVVVAITLAGSNFIAVRLYQKPDLVNPIRMGIMAIFGGICWSYYLSMLNAREMFQRYSVMSVVIGLLKLAVLGTIFYLFGLTIVRVLFLWMIIPIIGFAIGYAYTPTHLWNTKGDFRQTAMELLKFSRWIFLIDLSVMVLSRVDLLILGRYVSNEVLGYYSIAAYYMIYVFTILTSSFINVLLPHVAKFDGVQQMRHYAEKISKVTLALSLLCLPTLFLVKPIIHLLLGMAYDPAIGIFQIMFFGVLFNFIVEPIYLVVYPANKPQILSAVCLIKLAIAVAANLCLVPYLGAIGAALASVITNICGGIIALILIYQLVYKPSALDIAS